MLEISQIADKLKELNCLLALNDKTVTQLSDHVSTILRNIIYQGCQTSKVHVFMSCYWRWLVGDGVGVLVLAQFS